MFQSLSERLTKALQAISGKGRITENNIQDTLREVRMALLEADVALPVVKQFIADIRARAIGQEVLKSLTPGQALVKIVNDELIKILGADNAELNLQTQPPAVILVAGLQGSGKTTSLAKLALFLKNQKKNVLVVSTDVRRPAAIKQLEVLAQQTGVHYHPSTIIENPIVIAKGAIAAAKTQFIDVVLIDSAGRLHVDAEMMDEIKALHQAINPVETLFVVDSMTGQDAANTAKAFDDALPLTGVILTKTDGDARGGAALSIRTITGKPIKFMGTGEKTDALEPFYPDRVASRIMGMGDVLSLVEEAEQKLDKEKADKLAKKIKKGKRFDLADFKEQLQQMSKMGGMASIMGKIPGLNAVPKAMQAQLDDKNFVRIEAIINSMTPGERTRPEIIRGSRKRRIALGSGVQVQDVNRLLKQFTQMQKMMKKFSKRGGMMNMMKQLQGMLPPGGLPPM